MVRLARVILHRVRVAIGAAGLTLAFFLVLPFMQAITRPPEADTIVQTVDTVLEPPPPPPPEPEPEKEPEPEEQPPELTEEAPPLDLGQLELALNPGFSGDWLGGDFAVKLGAAAAEADELDDLFSMADLDQQPRVLYQPSPILDAKVRRKMPGKVNVIFIVDAGGRVESPRVLSSSDPVFERPALAAVRQWRFEPGKRNGRPVRFRMKIPITFQ
jgi:protein TonB